MIGTPLEMRAMAHDLTTSVWTLAAIGVLFESNLVDPLREPRTIEELVASCKTLARGRIERCLTVAMTAGVVGLDGDRYRLAPGAIPLVAEPMRSLVRGDIRSTLMQTLALLDDAKGGAPATGWSFTDPAVLQAQGDASAGLPPMFKASIIGTMGDLASRFEKPGARFLDVGAGVGALAIAMARAFPVLHVVGVDISDAPLAIARENVAKSNLGDRVELRQIAIQDLRDEESFDLAWLPTFFLQRNDVPTAIARVHASLRRGGWLLFPTADSPSATDRQRAVFSLINETWGGPVLTIAAAEALLKTAGFTTVRPLAGPPFAPVMLLAQR